MRRRPVVTCFLERDGKVLVLRRSGRVRTYAGKWAGVSGTMEGPDPATEALREVREELGLAPPQVLVVRAGAPLLVEDAALGASWEVHPVLARLAPGAEPRLDWDHDDARWVAPAEVAGLEAVPALAAALERVLHA